jgi:hypothetical protein
LTLAVAFALLLSLSLLGNRGLAASLDAANALGQIGSGSTQQTSAAPTQPGGSGQSIARLERPDPQNDLLDPQNEWLNQIWGLVPPTGPAALPYPVNSNNYSYGNAKAAATFDQLPVLALCGSFDGADVYIYTQDLIDMMPKDATQLQTFAQNYHSIPAYRFDGVTRVCLVQYCPELLSDSVRSELTGQLFPVNADGFSYGGDILRDGSGQPDLIAVQATNGQNGYIFRTDINAASGGMVRNPTEAVALMNSRYQTWGEAFRDCVYRETGVMLDANLVKATLERIDQTSGGLYFERLSGEAKNSVLALFACRISNG